ncbi:uncharacterized protein [Procambarus clarkii]|uniref:uncharacterized protein isoform X1 n=2 Tax=Procambarus clarkii TaxID=6728 RepID=UPI003741FE14
MIGLRHIRALLAVVVLIACVIVFGTRLIPASLNPVGIGSNNSTHLEDVPSCRCKLRKLNGGPLMAQQLDLELPSLNATTSELLARHHPNLPVDLLYQTSGKLCCSLLPSLVSIAWVNVYWQETRLNNIPILLYSATYDPNPGGEPCVRVLGVTRSTNPPAGWCHFWFNPQQPPVVAKVTKIDYLDYQGRSGDRQMPFMFTCPLPSQAAHLQPGAVSLVNLPCQPATTLLQVVGAKEREASAYQHGHKPADPTRAVTGWVPAVCGPALYYYHKDFSKRLVEWLEILRAEGFGRVFLYTANVHPNIEKVLNYYVDDGFVQLTRYSYPPPYINEPSIQRFWTLVERKKMFAQENIYFSDCLLRHMHQYRFIAHYDPDELPILLHHHNYTHFLDHLTLTTHNEKAKRKRKTPVAYRLRWNNFYNDLSPQGEAAEVPEYLWILRHTRRTVQNLGVTSVNFKALYDMNTVRGVFSHGVLVCTTGKCSRASMQSVSPEVAYLGHFTRVCGKMCEEANSTKEEPFLHKYRKPVSEAATSVLQKLELI